MSNSALLLHKSTSLAIIKGKITHNLRPPLIKRPLEATWNCMRCLSGESPREKKDRLLKVSLMKFSGKTI